MLVYKWPEKLLYKLDMRAKNYIYTGDSLKTTLTTVRRNIMSKPIVEGGIGTHLLKEFNDVGLTKLMWEFVKKEKHWARFLQARRCLPELL